MGARSRRALKDAGGTPPRLRRRNSRRLRARRAGESDPEAGARRCLTFVICRRRPDRRRTRPANHRRNWAQKKPCRRNFRNIDTHKARVGADRGRAPRVPGGLSRRSLGLRATLAAKASAVESRGSDRRSPNVQPTAWCMAANCLQARTLIWAAGVRASPAAEWLGCAPPIAPGRLEVNADLTVPGHPNIFCHRRYRFLSKVPERQAGPRHRAGGQAAGPAMSPRWIKARLRGENAGAVSVTKHSGSLAQIGQAQGGDRFRPLSNWRGRDCLVDLGHRAHLFPDRPAATGSASR